MSGAMHWTPSEDQVLREGIAAGKTFSAIAEEIDATRCMVAGRVYRLGLKGPRSWDSRPKSEVGLRKGYQRGEQCPTAKLTEQQVAVILSRHAAGEGITAISHDYPVSVVTIHHIVHRRVWKHVEPTALPSPPAEGR